MFFFYLLIYSALFSIYIYNEVIAWTLGTLPHIFGCGEIRCIPAHTCQVYATCAHSREIAVSCERIGSAHDWFDRSSGSPIK